MVVACWLPVNQRALAAGLKIDNVISSSMALLAMYNSKCCQSITLQKLQKPSQ